MSASSDFFWTARSRCSRTWSRAARRATRPSSRARMPDSYLIIEHAYKSFGTGDTRTDVLHDISLRVSQGEFISVIGHSGCGKSTLLNIVAGLTSATDGYV